MGGVREIGEVSLNFKHFSLPTKAVTNLNYKTLTRNVVGYVCDGEDVTDDGVESLDVMDHQEPLQGLVSDPPLRPESPDIPH